MSEDSPKITRNDNARKIRPTMQLYCPRMLRASKIGGKMDVREKNGNVEKSTKSVDTVKEMILKKEKLEEIKKGKTLVARYGKGVMINANNANLNPRIGNRRNNSSSSKNGTCKNEINSNESLLKNSNSVRRSCDHLPDGYGSPKGRAGRRMCSSSINCYNSSQSLCENSCTDNNACHYNGPASSRVGSNLSSWNQKEVSNLLLCINSATDNNSSSYQKEHCPSSTTYRYHQRQHISQQRTGYCDGDVKRIPNKYHSLPVRHAFGEGSLHSSNDTSSRTVFERRNQLNRQRNWSFRSNQSADFEQHRRNRNIKSSHVNRANNLLQDNNQDSEKKETVTKKPGTQSKHMSFQDLCASLDSIDLASFDWSSEVEAEERRKKEREEQGGISVEESIHANTNSQKNRSRYDFQISSKFQNRSAIVTANDSFGRLYSSHVKKPLVGHHFTNNILTRRRNDSFTSQTSSIAESIEEQCDVESGSGERTPTNDNQGPSDFCNQKNGIKRESCYLDEEIPVVSRVRGSNSPMINYVRRTCWDENRGRNKRGSRWRMRGKGTSVSNCNTAISQNVCRENDISATTSNTSEATAPSPIKTDTGSKTVAAVSLRIPQEHSDVLSQSNGIQTFPAKVSVDSSLKRAKSNRCRRELPPTEWPIHLEISCKEGPKIQALNDTISKLIDRVTESADLCAGEEILTASESLSKLYLSIVTRNINYTYTMNLEQHLWKQCFYTSIEALRAASKLAVAVIVVLFFEFCGMGLAFYALLLNKYEVAFGFIIDDYLYWPSSVPTDDFVGCILTGSGAHEATDHVVKVALLSVQRLAVSVGDLHRYSAMVSGIKAYSHAKLWYQKAAQLAAGNGRSYNQLALLAVYESKWIDVIFYYVRALAARYPFETARQPLFTAFNHVQKKVSEFEIEFNARIGDNAAREAEAAAARADRPQEIWIAQDGKLSCGDYANIADHRAMHALGSVSTVELFRRAVPYLLHTAGLLITKIGMEDYDNISERALFQLSQLISRDECPLSSLHLVQLCILFLYAVHSLTLKDSEPGTCSLQQQQAVQMVLSLFGVILRPVYDQRPDLSRILNGSLPIPPKMRRVMPAVFVISEWLSMPSVNRLYRSMPSLESIETSLIQVDTWKLLADIANTLVIAESKGILSRSVAQSDIKSKEYIEIVLPESVFLASFIDVFTVLPKSLRMIFLANIDLRDNSLILALHARLSSLLSAAEYLDGSELPCFGFDEHLRCFAATRCSSPITVQNVEIKERNADFDQYFDNSELKHETVGQDLELLERETKGNRIIIEVRPNYLVPDTNTFIDHLTSIKKIVESHRFTVLVPTTVFSELESLSRLAPSSLSTVGGQEDFQDYWVGERAKEAVAYLKDLIGKQVPQVYTITSKGNLLTSLMFATEETSISGELKAVNDDFILASCVNFAKTRSKPPNATAGAHSVQVCTVDIERPARLYRSVVLLTEDRALNIKAICENIPCRTVPSFIKWAALK
uniref:PIN domain-containing protein n=1 Tax=Setaria digitata TaxID=48799 RepID=A0A915Q301_9BILA